MLGSVSFWASSWFIPLNLRSLNDAKTAFPCYQIFLFARLRNPCLSANKWSNNNIRTSEKCTLRLLFDTRERHVLYPQGVKRYSLRLVKNETRRPILLLLSWREEGKENSRYLKQLLKICAHRFALTSRESKRMTSRLQNIISEGTVWYY